MTVFIIIIILLLFVIAFIQSIYNYIPETNHVSRLYTIYGTCNVISHVESYVLYISTFRSMCAVPVWLFSVVP